MSDIVVKKHFVEFRSPGTFFPEITSKEIDSWDVTKALEMMSGITERHGARPHSFIFITMGRTADELNARKIAQSHAYFVNCKIVTAEEVLKDTNPDHKILRANVENNGIKRMAVPKTGWVCHLPMTDDDVVIDLDL